MLAPGWDVYSARRPMYLAASGAASGEKRENARDGIVRPSTESELFSPGLPWGLIDQERQDEGVRRVGPGTKQTGVTESGNTGRRRADAT